MAETETGTTKRHPLAVAWDEWIASPEGDQCRMANTLAHNTNTYLENRLHRAFDAGARAASPAETEQLVRLREALAHALVTKHDIRTCACVQCEDAQHVGRAALAGEDK